MTTSKDTPRARRRNDGLWSELGRVQAEVCSTASRGNMRETSYRTYLPPKQHAGQVQDAVRPLEPWAMGARNNKTNSSTHTGCHSEQEGGTDVRRHHDDRVAHRFAPDRPQRK